MMPPPSYIETAALLGLAPEDAGRIADHAGRAKPDPKSRAIYGLIQNWRHNAPVLNNLCDSLVHQAIVRSVNEEQRQDILRRQPSLPREDHAIRSETGYLRMLRDENNASEIGAGAYAGAVLVVMDSMLSLFWRQLGADPESTDKAVKGRWQQAWHAAGDRAAGRYSFAEVVQAGSNNFRHYDDWRLGKAPRKDRDKAKDILSALLIGDDGKVPCLDTNVCPMVIEKLAAGRGFMGTMGICHQFFAYCRDLSRIAPKP